MTKALLLCFIVLRLCSGDLANAAVVSFPTCSAADVQSAFNRARAGDRIVGPTVGAPALGVATWTTQVKLNAPENLTVQLGCIITDNYKPTDAGPVLALGVSSSGKFRFTGGFQIRADAANSTYKYALVTIYSQNKQFRIDNFKCDTTQGAFPALNYAVPTCLMFWGQVNGVIDHSEFAFGDSGGGAFVIHGNGEGDDAWAEPTGLGTSNFLFFEDNKITNPTSRFAAVNDAYHGGRWVVRYNDIQKAGVQTHPTGGSGRARGSRAWEVYKNKFRDNAGPPHFNVGWISSGAGVIWGNEAPSGFSNFLTIHSMRFDTKTYPQYPVPDGWGFFPSIYDQRGSPLDQPGKGKSDKLSGPFPTVKNETRNCMVSQPACFTPAQATEGVYEWDNVWVGPGGGSKIAVYEPVVLLPNRDYFPDTKMPAYTPYAYPHPLTLDTTPLPVPAPAPSASAARSPAPPSAPSTVTTASPAPVDPCVAMPLKITGVKWPAEQTGNRSLSWNSASHKLSKVEFTWPGTAVFTDIRGCAVTVKK